MKAANDPPTAELPAVLQQAFNFRTAVNASMRTVELNGIEIQVGDTRGVGTGQVSANAVRKARLGRGTVSG